MPALPGLPRTWVAGEYPTAAQMNAELRDSVNFLANPPAVRAYHNVNQSAANGVRIVLALNSERYKTSGYPTMHDNVTNNSRITIVVAGIYTVIGNLEWAGVNATGVRQAEIRLNGATHLAITSVPAASSVQPLTVATTYKLGIGDYVELTGFQNSGGALNVNSGGNWSPELAVTWLGKG